MDPALAITNAQEAVTQANLPPQLQQAAFAEVLRYYLAGGAAAPGSQPAGATTAGGTTAGAGAGTPATQTWSQVANQPDTNVPSAP